MGVLPVPKIHIRELFYIPAALPFPAKHSGLHFFTCCSSSKGLTNLPIIKLVSFLL